jgi:hypothetical protein
VTVTNDIIGPPGDPALSEVVEYAGRLGGGVDHPLGVARHRWLGETDSAITMCPWSAPRPKATEVTENNLGYYLQARGEVMLGLGDMRLAYDAGVRYVETRQSSGGYRQGAWSPSIARPIVIGCPLQHRPLVH